MTEITVLSVQRVSKWFEDTLVLHEVSFSLEGEEILCLLGPSGSGKTTLLRIIAGLEPPDRGQVLFEGQDLAGMPPHHRAFGLMFQEYALFPHKNVFENVAFGLRMQELSREEIEARVQEMLTLVGLRGFEQRDVNHLSGGERQRVALARSLAPRPRLLMLDEPLGALDRTLRDRLLGELPAILRQIGQTAIYVTHDQEEALALADRVLIMHEGRVVQAGTPEEVYRRPVNEFIARFLGLTNLLAARIVEPGSPAVAETSAGRVTLDGHEDLSSNQPILILLPQTATLCSSSPKGNNIISGVVQSCTFRGKTYRIGVEVVSKETLHFDLRLEPGQVPQAGQRVSLRVQGAAVVNR